MKKFKFKKSQILKIALISLISIFILLLILYFTSVAPVSKNDNQIEVTIPLGTGTNKIAEILKQNKLITSKLAFKIYVKVNNISNFQAGEYYLKQSMGLKEITEMLKTGKMDDPNQVNITYIEGKNMRWLASMIEEKTNNKSDDVYALLKSEDYINSLIEKYWFITDEIKNEDIYYSLEGYLFPDTYTLKNKDIKVEEIFEIVLDQTEKVLNKYKEDIGKSKYNVHQILTIASIIEMESKSDESRKDVSSVIYNRLNRQMAIQSDVTTYYAFKIDVGDRDLYQKEINTYNRYNTRRTKYGRKASSRANFFLW